MAAERGKAAGTTTALLVLFGAAIAAYALDQLAKAWVVQNLTEGETVEVLGGFLQWQFVRNPGAAFSIASGSTWIFTILAAGVIGVIIWFARRIRSIAWGIVFGLLLGGVLGNLTDRLFREPSFGLGHVVDFISTPWMLPAIYNVADMAIVSSMVLFMILTISGLGLDGTRESRRSKDEVESGDEGDGEASGLDDTSGATSAGSPNATANDDSDDAIPPAAAPLAAEA